MAGRFNSRTRVEKALDLMEAVERAEDRRDKVLSVLRQRAEAHAEALDPTGSKYLRYRVPDDIKRIMVDSSANTVKIWGYCSRQGGPVYEEWTMPLDYANSDAPADEFLDSIREQSKREEAAAQQAAARRIERRERAEFARLSAKYGSS